jgi:hypothetical protein
MKGKIMPTQISATVTPNGLNESWNGEFYCSYCDSEARSWSDAVDFGFISGGGVAWNSKTLRLLNNGDRVWVYVPGSGFVGVGRVTGPLATASTFTVMTPEGECPVLEVAIRGNYHRDFMDDPERCEYFVPVQWLQTVPLEGAVNEIGLYRHRSTVCKPITPIWRSTVERLKVKFTNFDHSST